jgi:sec-independent protein translocase protein TatB
MFDIGFGEIFLIAVVALLVLGPERLPKAARFAGLWVRRARAQWYSVKAELENELADEELRRSLRQARDDLADAREALSRGGASLQQQIDDARTSVRDGYRELDRDAEPAPGTTTNADGQAPLPLAEPDSLPGSDAAAEPTAEPARDARR